jgi:hypothetical protein
MTTALVLAGAWLASGLAAIGMFVHAARKPVTDEDRRYDRLDRELDGLPIGEPEDVTPLVTPRPWMDGVNVEPLWRYRNGTPRGHRPAA